MKWFFFKSSQNFRIVVVIKLSTSVDYSRNPLREISVASLYRIWSAQNKNEQYCRNNNKKNRSRFTVPRTITESVSTTPSHFVETEFNRLWKITARYCITTTAVPVQVSESVSLNRITVVESSESNSRNFTIDLF